MIYRYENFDSVIDDAVRARANKVAKGNLFRTFGYYLQGKKFAKEDIRKPKYERMYQKALRKNPTLSRKKFEKDLIRKKAIEYTVDQSGWQNN